MRLSFLLTLLLPRLFLYTQADSHWAELRVAFLLVNQLPCTQHALARARSELADCCYAGLFSGRPAKLRASKRHSSVLAAGLSELLQFNTSMA
jgi:hypothetical protein